jgi:hypothetical protein
MKTIARALAFSGVVAAGALGMTPSPAKAQISVTVGGGGYYGGYPYGLAGPVYAAPPLVVAPPPVVVARPLYGVPYGGAYFGGYRPYGYPYGYGHYGHHGGYRHYR